MAGAFWFSPILRIGPIPTRATPGLNGQSSMRRIAPHARALFLRRSQERFAALRLLSFRRRRGMNDSNGTAAHGAVEISRLLPSVWQLVIPRAVLRLFPNRLPPLPALPRVDRAYLLARSRMFFTCIGAQVPPRGAGRADMWVLKGPCFIRPSPSPVSANSSE
jgi:hypothetical protein